MDIWLIPVLRRAHPVYRIPKYFWHFPSNYVGLPELENIHQDQQLTHKLEDIYIVTAELDAAQDAVLSAQADVLKIPPLDNTIPNTTVRDLIRNYLEAVNVPAQWINIGMAYRTVLRIFIGLWSFRALYQHFAGSQIFLDSLSLDKTVSQLSSGVVDALANTADALNLDYSAVTGTTTIRQLLYGMGVQFASTEYQLGAITI